VRYKTNPNPPHNWITEEEYEKVKPKRDRGTLIFGDLPDVVSPIDGTVIRGRRGFREHFKRHNVTFAEDFKEEWKKPRENPVHSKDQKQKRIEAIKAALERIR